MDDKLTDAELLALLEECPELGSHYRHYKTGNLYVVAGCAIQEATQSPLVIYQRFEGGTRFARPLSEWQESVEWNGKQVPRFTPA